MVEGLKLNKETEIKVLNCEIMFAPVFNNLNTPPYCLVKLNTLVCLNMHTVTITVKPNLMHVHVCAV
jgi:hypothetical protein